MSTNTSATLVSVNSALQRLGIGRTNFYARVNAGQIKAVHFGRRTFVTEAEIERVIANLEPLITLPSTHE